MGDGWGELKIDFTLLPGADAIEPEYLDSGLGLLLLLATRSKRLASRPLTLEDLDRGIDSVTLFSINGDFTANNESATGPTACALRSRDLLGNAEGEARTASSARINMFGFGNDSVLSWVALFFKSDVPTESCRERVRESIATPGFYVTRFGLMLNRASRACPEVHDEASAQTKVIK